MVNLATIIAYLYPNARPLVDFTIANGTIVQWDGAIGPQPTQQQIDDATLPTAKSLRVTDIRAQAQARILAKYPLWRQTNAALGVYPQAYASQMQADIAAVIEASNAAEDAVTAAADVAAVDAVNPNWPVI